MALLIGRHGLILIAVFLMFFASLICTTVSSEKCEVKFIGVVTEEEILCAEGTCYYGGYLICVKVLDAIFGEAECIEEGWEICICYYDELKLKPGELVECHGWSYAFGPCPLQFCGKVVCGGGEGYYIRRISAPPDLTVETIDFSPTDPSPGTEVVFRISVVNFGSTRAENFRV